MEREREHSRESDHLLVSEVCWSLIRQQSGVESGRGRGHGQKMTDPPSNYLTVCCTKYTTVFVL